MQGPVVPGGRRRQGFRPLPVIAVCPSLPAHAMRQPEKRNAGTPPGDGMPAS